MKGQALEKTRITKQIIKRKKETGENEQGLHVILKIR